MLKADGCTGHWHWRNGGCLCQVTGMSAVQQTTGGPTLAQAGLGLRRLAGDRGCERYASTAAELERTQGELEQTRRTLSGARVEAKLKTRLWEKARQREQALRSELEQVRSEGTPQRVTELAGSSGKPSKQRTVVDLKRTALESLLHYEEGLRTFVQRPYVPIDHNPAERVLGGAGDREKVLLRLVLRARTRPAGLSVLGVRHVATGRHQSLAVDPGLPAGLRRGGRQAAAGPSQLAASGPVGRARRRLAQRALAPAAGRARTVSEGPRRLPAARLAQARRRHQVHERLRGPAAHAPRGPARTAPAAWPARSAQAHPSLPGHRPTRLADLRPLQIAPLQPQDPRSRLWNEYIARYHYIGYKQLPGAQLCYCLRPVLLETFCESARFRGTCYRAANWIRVGQTQGRGKLDTRNQYALPVKDIFLKPIHSPRQVIGKKTLALQCRHH